MVEAPELDELRVGSGLKEGQIVQITCNIVSGDPPIFFSWLKDGTKIPASLKVTYFFFFVRRLSNFQLFRLYIVGAPAIPCN